jgi:hypothetical protein
MGVHSAHLVKLVYVKYYALPRTYHTADTTFVGQSSEFVDTLLSQNPGLLDALLTKANSSPRDLEEVSVLSSQPASKTYYG